MELPSANKIIPITRPLLDYAEISAIEDTIKSGWLAQGPRVAEFENKIRRYFGVEHAIATSSCTSALHLALLAAGIGPGDDILVPSFTFIATANAIEYTGARPVFTDIDPDTFNMDPIKVKEYLENRKNGRSTPKAIVPVSLFGLCADMEAINALAAEHGLIVIEDAACGFGSRREGRYAGTEALAGCFSFHPRKAITTGEGGMVITNSKKFADMVKTMRDHGASETDLARHLREGGSLLPEFNTLGFNYRMTDLQGALGSEQMNKLDRILDSRKAAASRYNEFLSGISWLKVPFVPKGYEHTYQSYVCLYRADAKRYKEERVIDWEAVKTWNRERNMLMGKLENNGISVRQGTHAVHTTGYYKRKYGLKDYDYPMAFIADRLSITLPLYGAITEEEQLRVINSLNNLSPP